MAPNVAPLDRPTRLNKDESSPAKEDLDNCLFRNFREGRDMSLSPNCEEFPGLSRPSLILDVGTFTGMSARIFLDFSTDFGGTVHTFDVIPWSSFDSHLNQNDFTSKRLFQHLVDLSVPEIFEKYRALFAAADLIFCDAPKDGIFEYKLLRLISNASLPAKERLLVLDDIRFLNMFPLWRSIDSPKLDATSLGHWSGTGLVDISEGLSMKEE